MKTLTLRQMRHHWRIYLLLLPAMAFVLTFSYFPAASGVYHSFFRWNGDDVAEYIGLSNFRDAISDPVLIRAFGVVMIFIAANLIKMIPSIITAVVIHRLVSDRARYVYRVAFVIPMVIPMMVWLLVWKYFYNPNYGILNAILKGTGLIHALRWLDGAMPRLADFVAPIRMVTIDPIFSSVWGVGLTGLILLSFLGGIRKFTRGYLLLIVLLPASVYIFGPLRLAAVAAAAAMTVAVTWGLRMLRDRGDRVQSRRIVIYSAAAVSLMLVVASMVVFGEARMIGIWIFAAGLCLAVRASERLRRHSLYGTDVIKWVGCGMIGLAAAIIVLTMTWTEPTGAFVTDSPSWLGHPKLIVPSLVFWGFPWVGVVSVLLYLSGLNNIDQSTYEAADIDGCGWFRMFTKIELPLIMTQVRLNLVLMIIGTLKGWGHVFIILGDTGGPDGAAMLPGLYMFRKAFRDGFAGYACAIGLLLFALILLLTLINNRYVRVEK